ncbi:MAG: DMT family transporter [Acidobacteria bacterium]|nr:DMT family transporter [Acidobacteriota bacterium]
MLKFLNTKGAAIFFLTGITAIWGWSFVIVKESISFYPVFSFLAVRFLIGSIILFFFIRSKIFSFDKKLWLSGFILGLFLFSGYAFQTTGLIYTTPAHSGFITGLFVVFTPILETLILKRRPHLTLILSLLLSTFGLFVLSYEKDFNSLNYGDFLSLICAIIYSFHLVFLDRFSKKYNVLYLAFLQVITVSFLSFAALFVLGSRLLPIPSISLKGAILTGVLATALSYFIQTNYQRLTTATEAALIFTLEPVFAGLFAYCLWGEVFSGKIFVGGALILLGMIMSQLRFYFEKQSNVKAVDENKI